ncbi:MAG TPA: S9 family peptidase, partial [Synergistaceae bacterium]|nr:S9 family peptidase [Synergistaceae bacterium]
MKRPVALDDLMKYRYLSAPAFSPDGRSIAFLVHQGNLEENAYRTDIWLAAQDGGSLRQLTASGKEKAFC